MNEKIPSTLVTGRQLEILDRMIEGGESFWDVIYDPFMKRDLTRDDLRFVVGAGLEKSWGTYKGVVKLFNMPPGDYKRFLRFLRAYSCTVPFQRYRK